jgi:phosphoenolpyruvate carboxykinase (ATP)
MLGERLRRHNAQCWLVNTGWTGGPYGVGKRIGLPHTRAMVHAVLDEQLADVEFVVEPTFGFSIPTSYPGVPYDILNPRNMWKDVEAYDRQAAMLSAKFQENFVRFDVPDSVRNAGPRAQK